MSFVRDFRRRLAACLPVCISWDSHVLSTLFRVVAQYDVCFVRSFRRRVCHARSLCPSVFRVF